jgi:hypothetical protein
LQLRQFLVLLALSPTLLAQSTAKPEPIARLVGIWQRDLTRFSATTLALHAEIGAEPLAPTCQLYRYGQVVDASRHWAITEGWEFRPPLPAVVVGFLAAAGAAPAVRAPLAKALMEFAEAQTPNVVLRYVDGRTWEWRADPKPAGAVWRVASTGAEGMEMVSDYFCVVGRDDQHTWAFHGGWQGAAFESLAPDRFRMLAKLPRRYYPDGDWHARVLTVSADGPWFSHINATDRLQSGADPGVPLVELLAEPAPAVAGIPHLPRLVTARLLQTDPPTTSEIRYHLVVAGPLSDALVAAMGQPERAVYAYPNGPSKIVGFDEPVAPDRKQAPPK